ncbi:type IV pilus biogenesis/stability protein PilW [Parvibium lacunae]|nr:type IV pilus biogenesis/stability protein PilW [Parvibium lacunae]
MASSRQPLSAVAIGMLFLSLLGCGTNVPKGNTDPSKGVVVPTAETLQETDARRRARLRLELGTSYYQQRQFAVALEETKQALLMDPSYADSYSVMGLILMDLGDRRQAEDYFQRGLARDAQHSDLNLNYGWFLCQNGREKEAIERFLVVARNPLYAAPVKPLQNAGICALRMGDRLNAERYFLAGYETDPNSAVVLYQLANLNYLRQDLTKARFYVNRLHSIYDPNAQTLWLNLKIERLAGNRDAEKSMADQLRQRFPVSRETESLNKGAYDE